MLRYSIDKRHLNIRYSVAQRETPPNSRPRTLSITDCELNYKAIRSPYRENTGSVFGGVSRCVPTNIACLH